MPKEYTRTAKIKRSILRARRVRSMNHPTKSQDSWIVLLECGHEKHYKDSILPKCVRRGQYNAGVYCTKCSEGIK